MLDGEWWLATYAVKKDFKLNKQQIIKLQLKGEVEARAIPNTYDAFNVYRLEDLERLTKKDLGKHFL